MTFVATLLLLTAQVYAGESGKSGAEPLSAAAEQMKLKNYSSAASLAAAAPESGPRNLLTGVAALNGGRIDVAVPLLAKAVDSYPLLADYALYYQARALLLQVKQADAGAALQKLQKLYPDSLLARRALLLQADTLFDSGSVAEAEALYLKFIEKFASGADALQASYRSAICREKQGDPGAAVRILRSIWLNSPASAEAAKAEQDLLRLAESGRTALPYTPQELLKRGNALYDQRNYEKALKTYRSIQANGEKKDFTDRLGLKIGQTILKVRRYSEAEQVLQEVAATAAKTEIRSEASHLMARAIEKSGRDDEAFVAYQRVAQLFPEAAEADDALLDAAFIRKFQNRPAETVTLLAKIMEKYPKTTLRQRIYWESGWGSYLAGKYREAAEGFKKLFSSDDYRERALYWHGKASAASSDTKAAQESHQILLQEYPFGYYALLLAETAGQKQEDELLPSLPTDAAALLPMPDGYDRVKGLLTLGLVEDAGIEMSAVRKKVVKGKSELGLARLYLEIGNYNSAMSLVNRGSLKRSLDSKTAWALLYPAAFAKQIAGSAEKAGISSALAYAIMRAESSFLPTAKSPVGARGLMQLMPETAAAVMRAKKIDPDKLYDPELNIRLGTKHLRDLLDQYKGDKVAVIASYNAGGHNVNKWRKIYGSLAKDEFVECIPFGETRDYVKKVLAAEAVYRRLYNLK